MSTAEDLLDGLTRRGVSIWQDAGRLHYRAPFGTVTPFLLAEIRRQKPRLLELLAANDCSAETPRVMPEENSGFKSVFSDSLQLEKKQTSPLVLTFELDAGLVTCIDPVSSSLTEAVASIRQQFPGRVGRFWLQGQELAV